MQQNIFIKKKKLPVGRQLLKTKRSNEIFVTTSPGFA